MYAECVEMKKRVKLCWTRGRVQAPAPAGVVVRVGEVGTAGEAGEAVEGM